MTVRVSAVPVDAPPCALGESPRWTDGAWWWVDADGGAVWTAGASLTADGPAPDGRATPVLRTAGRVSLVHPAADGTVVVARGSELLVLDPRSGRTVTWARVDLPPGWVLNDGTADDAGRLWIGSVHPERLGGAGRLHVVEPSGAVREVAGGLTLSNGMVWRAPTALLHADSLPRLVWEHRIDPSTGTVSGSFVGFRLPPAADVGPDPAALPDGVALPDGMARDVAGGTWVAMYGAAQVWRLVDGRVDAIVELPTPRVTSVALGGADGRDMLLTTAQEGMDAAALAADPWAGRLFRARVAVAGAPLARLRPNVTNP